MRSATSWTAAAGVAIDADRHAVVGDQLRQVLDVADREAADPLPTLAGSASTSPATRNPRSANPL